jgi:hypothetical protein
VDGDVTEYHVVHCQVVLPTGERPAYYRWNLDAPRGVFTLDFPLALSAIPGEWRVELRDVATGASRTLQFTVGAPWAETGRSSPCE